MMKFVKNKVIVFLLMAAFVLTSMANAQQKTITGKVTDSRSGDPMPGVTIIIPGTTTGTITNFDGEFTMAVNAGQALSFSFIGYETRQIVVGDQNVYNVSLSLSVEALEEVVVIGYGQVKKGDATGSVTAISSKDFNKGAITSAQDLLVGKSAGVVITTSGGAPGSGSTIRIRGGSSLNASNDPLLIIDGVPIDNSNVSGSSNLLAFVNPNDIETFTVLKDASATAIYGSRASNGVIIITTKKGQAGSPMKINYDANTAVSSAIRFLDVYSGDEIRQIALDRKSLFGVENLKILGLENTNWQKQLFRTGLTHDHNLSISGAQKSTPYRVSAGYTNQGGIMKNTNMERFTGAISIDPVLLDGSLRANINLKGMLSNFNFGDTGALGSAINMDPTQPVRDGNPKSAGYFQWTNYGANLGTPNPVEQLMEADNKSEVQRFIGNVQLNYRLPFLPDMRANLNLASDRSKSDGYNNRPTTSPSTLTAPLWGKLSDYSGKNSNDLLDLYLNYVKEIVPINSTVDATAGYSWQHFKREGESYTRGIVDATHPYQKSDSTSFISEN